MPETPNMTAPKPTTTTRTAPPPLNPYLNASRFEVPQEPPPSYHPTKPPPYTASSYRSPPRLGRDRQRQREQERERGREIHRSNMVRDVEMQRQDKKRRETNRGVRVVIAIIAGAIAGTIIGVVARYY